MWIPESGIRFRLLSCHINGMLCQVAGKTPVGGNNLGYQSTKQNYDYFDESWWTLEPSRVSGYYLIVHFTSRHRLYANGDREEKGLIGSEYYQHDDQLWKLRPNSDDEFQIISYCSDKKLFLRNHASPNIGVCDSNIFNYRDQFFKFFFEEPRVQSVQFELNKGRLIASTPKVVAQQTFSNNSEIEQSQIFRITYTQTRKHRWQYTGGFKLSVEMGVTFTAGIPLFATVETSFKIGMETDHHWTTEDVTTESKSMEYTLPLKVPPRKTLVAKAIIHEESGEVPYVIVMGFKGSGKTTTSRGIWKGVQCVHVTNEITEQ